jgi:hypothetical protein
VTLGEKSSAYIKVAPISLALLWATFAFLVKTVIATGLHLYSLVSGFEGFYPLASGADDRFYHWAAVSLVQSGTPENLPNAYPYLLAWIYQFVGPSLMWGKIVNVLLSSIAVYYGVLLAYELSRAKARLWRLSSAPNLAGLLLVAYPSGLFYGGQLLKDPAVLALGMASLYWSAKLLWKPRLRETIFLVIGLVGLYQFRGYASVALLGALSVYALTQIWRRPLYVALVALIAVLVPIALGWGPLGLKYLAPLLNPEKISHIREEVYSIGGSAVDISLDFSNPIAFLISYAYSFATVLLGPLPWQVKSPIVAIALVEAVPMWFLLATVWLRNSFRCADRRATFLVIFVLIYIGGLALISDNIGANTRLRLLPWSTLLVWIALQLEIQLERRRKHAPPLPHHSR